MTETFNDTGSTSTVACSHCGDMLLELAKTRVANTQLKADVASNIRYSRLKVLYQGAPYALIVGVAVLSGLLLHAVALRPESPEPPAPCLDSTEIVVSAVGSVMHVCHPEAVLTVEKLSEKGHVLVICRCPRNASTPSDAGADGP